MFNKVGYTLTVALCFTVLTACGTPKYATVTPELQAQFMHDLMNGQLTLTCDTLECAFSFNNNMGKMIELEKASKWEGLAELVMQVGFKQDGAYVFLAAAAHALGYHEAALKYLNYSWTLYNDSVSLHHCRNEITGNLACGGVDLGTLIPKGIAEEQAIVESLKNPFGYLTKFEGKDPVRENLWADSKFMARLEDALGRERTKQLVTGWGKGDPVTTEITRVEDNLVFAACKPNDQCYHQVIVFISMRNGTVEACWQDASSSNARSDFWLSPQGTPRKLPAGYCEMHDDTDLAKMFLKNTSGNKNH
jgi:hypothetical protein